MKKINTLLFFLLAGNLLMAQMPNGDMESWTKVTTGLSPYYDPTGWGSTNDFLNPLIGASNVFKDSTDTHGGKYAADLNTIGAGPIVATGGLFLGTVNIITYTVGGGIPFNQRPSSFSGAYKYTIPPALKDTAIFAVLLTRWNTTTNHSDSVGEAFFVVDTSNNSGYNVFDVPFYYALSGNPDTMRVFIASSLDFIGGRVGTLLKVDDLVLNGTATGVPPLMDIYNVSYYPNPVRDQLNIVFTKFENASLVKIYDLTGHVIQTVSVKGSIIPVNVQSLAAGMYFFSVIGKDGSVLKTDKFNKVN